MAVQEPIQNYPPPYPLHPQGTDKKTYGDTNNPPPVYESKGHSDDTPGIPSPAYQSFELPMNQSIQIIFKFFNLKLVASRLNLI